MADFKKAIGDILKPFARKIGSDIKSIESRVFTGKVINVVEEGIDNTGATDVTEKLNQLFQKVHNEDYTEVIFPDGTYKIGGTVNVIVPSDSKKYLYIHAQNRYKVNIEVHATRETKADSSSIYSGFQLTPETFTEATTDGYNVRFDGFIFNGHELPAEGSEVETMTAYGIFTVQDMIAGFDVNAYTLHNFVCTNTEFHNTYYSININNPIFDSEFKNVKFENGMYGIALNTTKSNNNKFENVVFKNNTFVNISAKASFKDIDIYISEEMAKNNSLTFSISTYLLSNLNIKGYYNVANTPTCLTINSIGFTTISDINIDLQPTGEPYISTDNIPAFINITQSNSSSLIVVNDLSAPTFETNFASVFEKIPKFSFINSNGAITLGTVNVTDHLVTFSEKGTSVVYEKTGSYNVNYNTRNSSYRERLFLGADRNMNGLDRLGMSNFAALYLASSEGTPLSGNGIDYSENTAAPSGDIFTDVAPGKNGHFAYISTFAPSNEFRVNKPKTLTYNEADKTYTATFTDLPVFTDGTLKGKPVNVGSLLEEMGGDINFEITAVNETDKSLTLKAIQETKEGYPHPYTLDGSVSFFTYGGKIKPRKVNRMKNMPYETVPIIHSGTTENRPTEHLVIGQMYFDTTVGAPVFWDGTQWIQGHNGGGDTSNLATKQELHDAIAAIPAATPVDTSNFVTKQELDATLNAINEKLKQIHGGNE